MQAKAIFLFLLLKLSILTNGQPCIGFDADAGPDVFSCDPSTPPQLMGSFQGSVDKYSWTPTRHLSNPNALDPFVNAPPGKYKYKLMIEGTGTTNLIRNGDFEAGNTGFTHEYRYGNPGGPFGPGWLSVGTDPSGYNSAWSRCGDHTSGSGNQLIVDGHTTQNARVWCQTVAVTNGQTYLFRFYVQSVFPDNPANLSVRANGTAIGSISAGPVCEWKTFEACFTANSSSVEMCIVETTGIGYGNDFAIDDIEMFVKCKDEDEVEVEIVDLIAQMKVPVPPKCESTIFDLTAAGSSTGPFIRYEWRNEGGKIVSQQGQSAKGRGSGIYYLKVIYDNKFAYCEKEISIEVEASDDLAGDIEADGIATCKLDTVKLKANVQNGSGRYSFNWAPSSKIVQGSQDSVAFVTQAGLYKAIIIDKESGCQLEVSYVVIADTIHPSVSLSGDTLLTCQRTMAKISSSLQDTSRYKWLWTFPDQSSGHNPDIYTDKAGEYLLTVIDKSNACRTTRKWHVAIDTLAPWLSLGPDLRIDCQIQQHHLFPQIGDTTKSYFFKWKINDTQSIEERVLLPKIIDKTSEVILELIDSINGCQARDTIRVVDLRVIPAADAGQNDTLNCSVPELNLSGKTTGSDFLTNWSTRSGNIVSHTDAANIIIDRGGWYYFHVIDTGNHCENVDSVFIDELKQKPKANAGDGFTFACKDSILYLDGSNSNPIQALRFNWLTQDGLIFGPANQARVSIKKAGTYVLMVEDSTNFCRDTQAVVVIPDQNSPQIELEVKDTLNCSVKELNIVGNAASAAGGHLEYDWATRNGNILSDAKQRQIRVNRPGRYMLTVTDTINGCSAFAAADVVEDIVQPGANAGADVQWLCNTQSVTLRGMSPSTKKLKYSWTSPNGIIHGNPNQAQVTASQPGMYVLNVVNVENGCESADTVYVVDATRYPSIIFQTPDTLTCIREQVLLDGSNSSSGTQFFYQWKDAQGQNIAQQSGKQILVNKAGKYILHVVDSTNFCSIQDTIEVFENRRIPLIKAGDGGELTCKIHSLLVEASGDVHLPIQWSTANGKIIGAANTPQIWASLPGTYRVTVRDDSNGCENTDSVTITQNTNFPVGMDLELRQPQCSGDKGQIKLTRVLGGERPLQLYFNGRVVNRIDFSNLDSGKYHIKVVDKNDCEVADSFTIVSPPALQIQLPPLIKLNRGSNYQIEPRFSIPIDSIAKIEWMPAVGLSCSDCPYPRLVNLQTDGEYTVWVTDTKGCRSSASIRIELAKRYAHMPNVFSPNGDGINDHFFPVLSVASIKRVPLMQVYDRWGELVFEQRDIDFSNPTAGWNGQYKNRAPVPGVYVYTIEIEWLSGESQRLSGDVSLVK